MITSFRIETTCSAILLILFLLLACGAGQAYAEDDALASILATQREAEARAAIAEAERAEVLARLPPATAKPLSGAVDLRQFGAAGLVKPFDLARQLAGEVCTTLHADKKTAVYETAVTQGVPITRLVQSAIE